MLVSGGFGTIQVAATAFLAKYWLADASQAKWILTGQAAARLISVPAWAWATRRYGKRAAWVAGSLLTSLSLAAAWMAAPTTAMGMAPFYAVAQVGYAAFLIVFFAMTADVVDWNEARGGGRHEGVAFGAIAFANKLAAGLAAALTGRLFASIGIGGTTAASLSLDAKHALLDVALLLPAGGFALSAILVAFYPIGRAEHAAAVARLQGAALDRIWNRA